MDKIGGVKISRHLNRWSPWRWSHCLWRTRILKVLRIVDDSDIQGATRAASNLLTNFQIRLSYLEKIAAGTGISERLQFLVPFHILNLHVVVRHLASLIRKPASSISCVRLYNVCRPRFLPLLPQSQITPHKKHNIEAGRKILRWPELDARQEQNIRQNH